MRVCSLLCDEHFCSDCMLVTRRCKLARPFLSNRRVGSSLVSQTHLDLKIQHSMGYPSLVTRRSAMPSTNIGWTKFRQQMEEHLPLEEAPRSISTVRQFEEVRQKVMDAIQKAIESHVPLTQPCPYNNHWWTKDLSILRGKQQ